MCGRYTVHTSLQVIADLFEVDDGQPWTPRYNVAPSQEVPVVRLGSERKRELVMMRWGLVPYWSEDPKIGYKVINARSETLVEKPAFREAYKSRRCLIVADGFYEWKKIGATKQPYWIHLKDEKPFAFAGLWEQWKAKDASREITSCTILTTQANAFVAELHDRMPVILPKEAYASWIDPSVRNENELTKWLKPYDAALMDARPISQLVNSPNNDDERCIAPVAIVEPSQMTLLKDDSNE